MIHTRSASSRLRHLYNSYFLPPNPTDEWVAFRDECRRVPLWAGMVVVEGLLYDLLKNAFQALTACLATERAPYCQAL